MYCADCLLWCFLKDAAASKNLTKIAQNGFTSALSCMHITCTNVDNRKVLALLVGVDCEYLTNLLHVNWIFSR